MRKRGNIRTFNKQMYRKSPIIPSPIAVKRLNKGGYLARTVKYANGDQSLFIKKAIPQSMKLPDPIRPYFRESNFDNFRNENMVRDLSKGFVFMNDDEYVKDRMTNLRNQAYSKAKELRWLIIREKSSGNFLSIGLVPEPIARMHLDMFGFDVANLQSLNEWKKEEGSMTFGLSEPIGQQLIDLQRQNNALAPSFSMDRINEEFDGELEYIISPERARFEDSLSNDRIDDIIEITGKTPNPFMGEQNTEFFRLYSWLPESALYLTMEETESIVDEAYSRIGNQIMPYKKDDKDLFGFVGVKMLGQEGLKNDIGLGINLQTEMNNQFYQDMKNVQKDSWINGETKPYIEGAIGSVAEDYGISPEDYLRLEGSLLLTYENPQAYKDAVLEQLESMFGRGDEPISWFTKNWESN